MNMNFVRTVLTWAAIFVTVISSVFGCTTDAVSGAVNCTASWISPAVAGYISLGLLVLNQVLKAAQGQLVAPTAAVSDTGKPGTVPLEAVRK